MSSKYSNVILTFFTVLNQIKIYHWQTVSYPRHKATDDLHSSLSDLVDKFVEVLHGRLSTNENPKYRITLEDNKNTITINNMTDSNGLELLKNIRKYLEGSELKSVMGNSTELINIRDEMLSEVNKCLYLFSLN
jgi:hypothetical protein